MAEKKAQVLTLVNTVTPFLKIFIPDTGEYRSFQAGQLEIAEDDPDFEVVKAEALRNPSISIQVNSTTCRYCGEVFTGKAGAAQLGKHKKAIHFDVWQAEQFIEQEATNAKELKARAGFACDVCSPVQTFGTAADLADHVNLLHTAPPEMDDEGNERGGRPGEREIPAATASAS